MAIAQEVSGEGTGSVWELPGECLQSAREVLVEAVLEVVGSAELSANTCKTAQRRFKVVREGSK